MAEGRQALEDALELSGRRPARALLGLCSLRVFSGNSDGLLDDVQEVLRAAEELGDPLTLTQAWNLLGRVEGTILGSLARAEEAWQQALEHAERGNLPTERAEIIGWLMMAANFGPLPVEEGIARCRRFHDEAVDDPFIRGNACVELGALRAMRGDFPLGRALVAEGLETIAGLGFSLRAAMSSQEAFYVEMLAGDLDAAERIARDALTTLERMGERSYLSSAAALLAHALSGQGELDEAERFSHTSEETSAADDAFSQVLWRSARAKIRARRGELAEAEALAREAVALAERTDLLNTHGDTLADLGEVLALAGRPDEAVAVYERGGGDLRAEGEPRLARAGPRRRAGARPVTYDVLVLGGGAAGCALAGRLSENPDRTVCLVEAGPDYGHLSEGRWPADILDPRWLALESHLWERADEDDRSQARARILGGCSAHNACVLLEGAPSDYEWGGDWTYEAFAPYLRRAYETLARRTCSPTRS